MRTFSILPIIALSLVCITLGSYAQQAQAEDVDAVIAQIPDSSPMSKLRSGMTESQVREIMGREDEKTSYETGKKWIPKFGRFANDTRRHSLFFNKQGSVVMSYNKYTRQYKLIEVNYEPDAVYD
jgi:hypothetical protein